MRKSTTIERVLVEAGAGCGKTTSIIATFLTALQTHREGGKSYLPEECLLLTFTEAAAREMRARLKLKDPRLNLRSTFVGTFHSYCLSCLRSAELVDDRAQILNEEELALLKKRSFLGHLSKHPDLSQLIQLLGAHEILNRVLQPERETIAIRNTYEFLEERWRDFSAGLTRELNGLDLEDLDSSDWPHQALKLLGGDLSARIIFSQKRALKDISAKRPELVGKVKALRDLQERQILSPLVGKFSEEEKLLTLLNSALSEFRRQLHGHLSFAELESRFLEGLRSGRVKPRPLKLIIVDEFQDTSPEQWEILRLLSGNSTEWYLVGDPKQSIYAFRRADIRLYKKLKLELEVKELSVNYRSTPELLQVCNAIQEQLFSGEDDPDPQILTAGKTDKSPQVPVALVECEESDKWPRLWERIQERDAKDPGKTHTVLFREWKKLYAFSEYLFAQGISFAIEGSENALDHFLGHAFLDWLGERGEAEQNCDPLTEYYKFCFEHQPERWPQGREWASAMERLLIDLHRKEFLHWRQIAEIMTRPGLSSPPLLRLKAPSRESIQLSLMTIHGSKGLEFHYVYLPDPRERVSSHQGSAEDELPFSFPVSPQVRSRSLHFELQRIDRIVRQESEQKRLFYVAMTRAALGLDFFLPPSRESTSSRSRSEEFPWWRIWKPKTELRRLKWSELLGGLSEQLIVRIPCPRGPAQSKARVILKPHSKRNIAPQHQEQKSPKVCTADSLWGETLHFLLENWNGKETQLPQLMELISSSSNEKAHLLQKLGIEEKPFYRELIEALVTLRKETALRMYWQLLEKPNPQWKILREIDFIEQSEDGESLRRPDLILLSRESAHIIDWKSARAEERLQKQERKDKIERQLRAYMALLQPSVNKVIATAIGIYRQPTIRVEKVVEIS